MSFYTYTKDPIGCFVEKDTGNYFEYSKNDDVEWAENYPHKIWVGGEGVCGMRGWRHGNVKKTVYCKYGKIWGSVSVVCMGLRVHNEPDH